MLDLRSPAFTKRLEDYKEMYGLFMVLSAESTHRRLTAREQKGYRALRRGFDRLIRSKKRNDKEFLSVAFRIANLTIR
jgi:hypothetical protein